MADAKVVLVIPNDPVLGALLGELASLAGFSPRFAHADETVRRAAERLAPDIVLLDCDHEECGDELLTAVRATGVPIVFFSGSRSGNELERIARRHGVSSFLLPNGPKLLRKTLDAVFG